MPTNTTHACNKCSKVLPLSQFHESCVKKKHWCCKTCRSRAKKRSRQVDPVKHMRDRIYSRTQKALKKLKKDIKMPDVAEYLGCSWEYVTAYLLAQLPTPTGQSPYKWWSEVQHMYEIDHIEPLGGFEGRSLEEKAKRCHYTNLRLLSKIVHCAVTHDLTQADLVQAAEDLKPCITMHEDSEGAARIKAMWHHKADLLLMGNAAGTTSAPSLSTHLP